MLQLPLSLKQKWIYSCPDWDLKLMQCVTQESSIQQKTIIPHKQMARECDWMSGSMLHNCSNPAFNLSFTRVPWHHHHLKWCQSNTHSTQITLSSYRKHKKNDLPSCCNVIMMTLVNLSFNSIIVHVKPQNS